MKKERILVIDDDQKLCALMQEYLSSMDYEVELVHTGNEGLERASTKQFDAVILDVMLPEINGFDLLKELRKKSAVPVLMLTSRGDETDRIVGLEMGADDYIPKTFSTRELLARLRAVIRRYQTASKVKAENSGSLEFGNLHIDRDSKQTYMNEKLLELTPIEYLLLTSLAESNGVVLSRDELLEAMAGREYDVYDRSIDMHVSSLRKKLGDNPKEPTYIKTVRAFGYTFLGGTKEP